VSGLDGSIVFAKDGDIYAIDSHGARNLSNTEEKEAAPAWSADARRIVFSRDDGEMIDLYTMDADGGHQKQLTRTAEAEWSAGWSPNGKQIAFSTFTESGGGAVWVMNADATQQQVIYKDKNAFVGFEDWSPDGRTLLLGVDSAGGGQLDLFAIGVNGQGLTALTTAEGDDSGGRWSPDGTKIVFWSDGYPPREGPGIYVMTSDGADATIVLADTSGIDTAALAWSPDGKQIAWTAKFEGGRGSPIFLMTSAGSDVKQITESLAGATTLDWTGEGQ
jgi:TolB protein